jgi:hypothetical protein
VAPLVKTIRPLFAPSTRSADSRALVRMLRARKPATWELLGLPKKSCIVSIAA